MPWDILGYQDERGRRPVSEFIESLPPKARARIRWTLNLFSEFGLQLGMPYSRPVRGKIWELRIKSGRSIYRIFYFAHQGRFVLLHAFQKKGQKTPEK